MDRPDDDNGNERERNAGQMPRRRRKMSPVVIIGIVVIACVVGGVLLIPTVLHVVETPHRTKSSLNLKMIGLAAHNYADTYGELPANVHDEQDKPLLSWRVLLLPYLEHDMLFRQFKMDEPWDSPNNIRLLNQMPRYFANPKAPSTTMTHYRGFTNPGAAMAKNLNVKNELIEKKGLNFSDFKDSTSNTILVVEAGEPVEWTKPDGLDGSPDMPLPPLGGIKWSRNRMHVLFVDGRVRFLRRDLPETTFRALITHSGGESLPPGWDD
jgi:prepilin-type processing-associated H-X9-DG protein